MDEHEEHPEEHAEEGHAESAWDVMSDPAHLGAEMAFEGIFFILSILWIRFKLRRRDKEHQHCEAV